MLVSYFVILTMGLKLIQKSNHLSSVFANILYTTLAELGEKSTLSYHYIFLFFACSFSLLASFFQNTYDYLHPSVRGPIYFTNLSLVIFTCLPKTLALSNLLSNITERKHARTTKASIVISSTKNIPRIRKIL